MNLSQIVAAGVALGVVFTGPALAAPKPRPNQACLEDFHKYCPTEALGRGVVIRCARAHIDSVSAVCKTSVEHADAVNQARRQAKAAKRAAAKTAAG